MPVHVVEEPVEVLLELPREARLAQAGGADDGQEPGAASSTVAWKSSFARRSSRSRPTNGDSRPTERPSPPRLAMTRRACHSWTGSAFPLSSRSPAAVYAIAASVARCVESPTRTVPGAAAAWMRDAVLTRSPVTMPWPSAPTVTAASPVSTPARSRRSAAIHFRPSWRRRRRARAPLARPARRRPRARRGRPRRP